MGQSIAESVTPAHGPNDQLEPAVVENFLTGHSLNFTAGVIDVLGIGYSTNPNGSALLMPKFITPQLGVGRSYTWKIRDGTRKVK